MLISAVGIVGFRARSGLAESDVCIRQASTVIVTTHASIQSIGVQLFDLGQYCFEVAVMGRRKFIETVVIQRQALRRIRTQCGRRSLDYKLLYHYLAQYNSV